MQHHHIAAISVCFAALVGFSSSSVAQSGEGAWTDSLTPVLGPELAPAPPLAEPVEGPAVPRQAAPDAASDAASERPVDAAWSDVLAALTDEEPVENSTNQTVTAVGPSSMPADSARGVAFLALFLLGALALHPRTRRLLLARLGRTPALEDVVPGTIHVLARHELGGGRRLVMVTVDERRVLLGVGPQRIEVLDRWIPGAPALAEATVLPAKAETAAPPLSVVPQAPVTPEVEAPPAAALVEEPRRVQPSPQVAELLKAWRNASPKIADGPDVEFDADDDTPWWLEGADKTETARLLAAAEEPHMRAPEALPRAAVTNQAASVLARLRAARVPTPAPPRTPPPASTRAPEPKKRSAGGGRRSARLVLLMAVSALVPFLTGVGEVFAAEIPNAALQVDLGEGAGAASAVKLLVTLTFLAVLPALVLSMTSFTRLIVVFSMLRQALAVQQAPPNQILVGLALFLTWFIMGPTFEQVHDMAVEPYMDGQMSEVEAVEAAMGPMRDFMLRNTRANDLALFLQVSRSERPETRADVPTRVLVPAFLISELKTAFQIGFLIYIPFLVIDLVVSTVLLAMGMMVLPPVVISLPFKLLLFVFVDGWNLLAGSLVKGFA